MSDRTYNAINNTGNGIHNVRYSQSYLDAHLDSYTLKPVSPYDTHDPNEAFYNDPEPDLPPLNDPSIPLPYTPLERPRWIRVLKLEPGYVYMKIRVSLVHIDLDSPSRLPYEAISYTWGAYYAFEDDKKDWKYEVICNDRWVRVTRSLFHALSMFRRTDRARIIWADALCINQGDEEEKGYQVGLMQQIYKQAFHVLIWIGYRWAKVVRKSMDLVCTVVNQECSLEDRRDAVAEWYDEPSILEMDDVAPGDPDSPSSFYAEDFPESKSRLQLDGQTMEPLKDLFEALYFSRLWVFQEVALSPLATMFWGQARIRFEWVALVANLISRNPDYLTSFSVYENAINGLQNCAKMYNAWRGEYAETPFFDLLISTRALKSGVRRDKVYGLLGIKTSDTHPDQGVVFMKADYVSEEQEVWRRVAFKILIEQGDVRCLTAVNRVGGPTDSPSWIPDFANLSEIFLTSPYADVRNNTAEACVSVGQHCSVLDCLTIQVTTVDSVASLISPNFEPDTHWRHVSVRTQLYRLIRNLMPMYPENTLALCLTQGFDFSFTTTVINRTGHGSALRAFCAWSEETCLVEDNLIIPPENAASSDTKAAYKFFCAAAKAIRGKRLFITRRAMLGVGPDDIREGDIVVLAHGSRVPSAVRNVEGVEGGHWRLLGPCYVDGMKHLHERMGAGRREEMQVLHII